MLSDSSHCAFIPGLPLPLAMESIMVFVFPLTCENDGAGWVAATCRVVMDTLPQLAQLGERWSAGREVVSSNPSQTNTQGLNL